MSAVLRGPPLSTASVETQTSPEDLSSPQGSPSEPLKVTHTQSPSFSKGAVPSKEGTTPSKVPEVPSAALAGPSGRSRGLPPRASCNNQKPRRTEQPPPPKGPTLSPDEKMDESLPLSEDDQSLPEAESLPLVFSEVLKDAKAKGLHILTGWFERVPASHLLHHALAIKDVSCQLLFRDKTAKVRLQALVLLSKVLEACKGDSVFTQLDVRGLVERMFMLLSQPSKLTPTVKEEILCVLGVIAECHQDATEPYRDKLLALYLAELQRVCSVKEKNVVAGCLQGLSGFLFHFGTCFEDDPDNCFKLFKCVKRSLTPSDRPGRYDIPRAALILLSKHAALFGQFLLEDHRTLYQQLNHWSRHGNREVRSVGTAALESFLREVASALVEHADRQDYLDIFQFFIKDFQRTLKMETSNHGLAAALKGYGLFALPCKRYLKEADVLYMLNDVLLRSEHVFQSGEGIFELRTRSFPPGKEDSEKSSGVPAGSPGETDGAADREFPLVAQNLQMRYCKSLLFVLLAVYPISRSSLSQIVYQGLVRTCSHPIAAQVEAPREDDGISQSRTITYRRYNFLWAYLLNAVAVQELNQMQISLEARQMLVQDVYDGLLSSALSVVSKLNLSVRQQASSDDEVGTGILRWIEDTFPEGGLWWTSHSLAWE
ncbi:hypothetical protein HPB47_026405 [Ixodes persulcatus]|uniref:Uncharacterized protein n=1 Tax=Ixodes persulcatus TaxID=34615 RepID=A0AC60PZ26_IXOPE|nr:hypothetical protein HPB47_026405 [Ixodes persulcatus]